MAKDKYWYVYKHTNKINQKVYIGITSTNPNTRWRNDGKGYKGQVFYNAIQKYGWENFEHKILFENISIEDACEKEAELIKKYNSNKEGGYNISEGGIGYSNSLKSLSNSNGKAVICLNNLKTYSTMVEAERDTNILSTYIGRCCRKEIKYTTNNTQWMYLDEYNAVGKSTKDEYNFGKEVICLETKIVYKNATIAELKTNICKTSINKCCKGRQKTSGGFHWMLLEDYNENIEIVKERKNGRKVLCVETTEIFNSLTLASEQYKIDKSLIMVCCKNPKRTAKGFHWKYID